MPLRKHNTDREFTQDRVPLIVGSMDVGSCKIVGRTLTGTVRSPRFASTLIDAGYRAVRVVVEVERIEDAH